MSDASKIVKNSYFDLQLMTDIPANNASRKALCVMMIVYYSINFKDYRVLFHCLGFMLNHYSQ